MLVGQGLYDGIEIKALFDAQATYRRAGSGRHNPQLCRAELPH
jgi:hypothetical protein